MQTAFDVTTIVKALHEAHGFINSKFNVPLRGMQWKSVDEPAHVHVRRKGCLCIT